MQSTYNGARGRADKASSVHPLSGLLVCPDCGKRLKFKSAKDLKNCFVCRTYVDLGKKYCTSHRITEHLLEKIVTEDIRSMLAEVTIDEDKAKERFLRERAKHSGQSRCSDEKQLKAHKNRLAELDKLIQTAFEERVLGNLPESVCIKLCEKYRAEAEAVQGAINALEKRLSEVNTDEVAAEEYIQKLKRYVNCERLTREMCLQLIDFITIGERTAENEEREIHIYYKFRQTD